MKKLVEIKKERKMKETSRITNNKSRKVKKNVIYNYRKQTDNNRLIWHLMKVVYRVI